MRQPNLKALNVSELVDRFATNGVEQDKAEDDNARFKRLFWQMDAIVGELKSRPGDQRRALLSLYDHPNMQVRLKAAKHTLAVAPQQARRMLEAIANSKWFPQAGDAGMCLSALDKGIFVPD